MTSTTTTKKHRATEPLATPVRPDLSGGAHRSSRNRETVVLLSLGTFLIVFAMVMTLRG
ncbi:hypothetical protein [Nocardioides humilatus]|uniref:hypothetical protein n=1 Tax=Nocardioides humilatus TaxID=2607660 RepID=UPI00165EF3FF|nr:hypothetical protein [Nocardioides humilatus]